MDKRISSNIKIFSFVVSCFMVLFHAGMYDNSNAVNQFDRQLSELINYDYKLLAFFGLSFFFSVTGFLLFYGLNYRNYLKKIERRVHSLLIPYLIWQALVLIKDLCIGRRYEILDVLLRTFGLELWPLNGPLWYVYVVFLLALLLSPVLLLMFSSKRSAWISTFAMLILIRFLKQTSIEPVRIVVSYGLFSRILTYLPAYMIGAYYGRFYEKNRMPESMVYSLAVVLFAIYDYTFLIYALHHPFIVDLKGFIDEGLAWIPIPVTILNIFEHLLILAASVLLAAGLSKLLEKLSPKILAVLTGGRTPVTTGDSTSG